MNANLNSNQRVYGPTPYRLAAGSIKVILEELYVGLSLSFSILVVERGDKKEFMVCCDSVLSDGAADRIRALCGRIASFGECYEYFRTEQEVYDRLDREMQATKRFLGIDKPMTWENKDDRKS